MSYMRNTIDSTIRSGVLSIIAAAVLFGLSTPVSKLLLNRISPLYLAGFLYLGSGFGLLILEVGRYIAGRGSGKFSGESRLLGGDYLKLFGAIICGGVIAPILLTLGLNRSEASSASLFLNFESVMTALFAFFLFREPVGRRVWAALIALVLSGVILSYEPVSGRFNFSLGLLLIVGACLMWGLDNNITQLLSGKDPFVIARMKGLVAGSVSLGIAYAVGEPVPEISYLPGALVLGAFSYGISLVLFVYALRFLGTSRTGAYFSLAPFIGSVVSVILLGELVTWNLAVAFIMIAFGMKLLLTEDHIHEHGHKGFIHVHRHRHDDHHLHEHPNDGEESMEHSHFHDHPIEKHSHRHMPDIHHRHLH